MAKRLAIPSKELQLFILGARDFAKASRVQRLSINTDIPVDTKDELGNNLHVGDVKDTPNITLTFQAYDVGIKIFSALAGKDATSYPGAGVDISVLGEIDAVAFVKDPDVSDYVKSLHARRLQIRDFTYSYSVDGDATEEYTAIGSEKRWLKYDVVVDKFTTGTTSFTLTQTPIQLRNGRYALSVILDGEYLEEVSAAPATGEYRIVGTTLTTGDSMVTQALVAYHANPAGNNWAYAQDASMPAAIKGKDVVISLAAGGIKRVQSVTINGNLNTTPVKELGNRVIVGYQRQVPTVEGTITVLDTDTELVSLLTYGIVSSGVEWQPGEGCVASGISLTIELQEPCDVDVPFTILKTVHVPSITITGDSYTVNVNENASQVFNWKSSDAQCVVYSGSLP